MTEDINKRRKVKRKLILLSLLLFSLLFARAVYAELQSKKTKTEPDTKIVENINKNIAWNPEPLQEFPKGETVLPPKVEVVQKVAIVSQPGIVETVRGLNSTYFGEQHWSALYELIRRESGWNQYALNPSSSAGGLFQALPYSKVGVPMSDLEGQVAWGFAYIKNRYGNPTNALAFQIRNGWY